MFTTIIALCACVVIALRLLLFRRGNRRHCWHWAAAAWLMINAATAAAIYLLLALAHGTPAPLYVSVPLTLLACQVFRARGNAAKLWRLRR